MYLNLQLERQGGQVLRYSRGRTSQASQLMSSIPKHRYSQFCKLCESSSLFCKCHVDPRIPVNPEDRFFSRCKISDMKVCYKVRQYMMWRAWRGAPTHTSGVLRGCDYDISFQPRTLFSPAYLPRNFILLHTRSFVASASKF